MDFSKDVFQNKTSSRISSDAMNHANMVMAVRFGWTSTAGPENGVQTPSTTQPAPTRPTPPTFSQSTWTKRFAPCRGRLYHQLTCSHRVRTDFVENCGVNCLDPLNNASDPPFYCHECVEKHASQIWVEREAQHDALYPLRQQMTDDQYEMWYVERRQLEARFEKDRKQYELELKATSRPAHVCSALEASQDEVSLAAEVDSLSLAMSSSNPTTTLDHPQPRPNRINLPNDSSEQLHWGLNALSIDRGSCGVEYSNNQSSSLPSAGMVTEDVNFWRKRTGR
ncbi:hypothetical protein K491DRAFT_141328 [Lophiostoma macrostomum CBS 122681]|uniref:Uncharacterized protein n=1 Tax=Lophiostoma macrostomum CBS 122681 TaxID=1314788 RepID=A0A6A6SRP7_9PLEO|nr:hypothetical protein K491DRAFT_141328 [Lophiostoma macrostomum CBS 122681]